MLGFICNPESNREKKIRLFLESRKYLRKENMKKKLEERKFEGKKGVNLIN